MDAELERDLKSLIESSKKGESYNKKIERLPEFHNPEIVQVFFS